MDRAEPLSEKVIAWQTSQLIGQQQARWQEHNVLERGNNNIINLIGS